MKAYTTVLFILIGVLVTLLYLRSDVETTILRTPGMMYQEREDGTISNLYQLKMVNKTAEDMPIELRLEGIDGKLEMVGDNLLLKKQGLGEGAFFIVLDPADLTKMSTDIQIGVYSNGEQIETVKTRFLGPAI